jgi:hypothetical protein
VNCKFSFINYFIPEHIQLSEKYCGHYDGKGPEFVELGFKVSEIVQEVKYGYTFSVCKSVHHHIFK